MKAGCTSMTELAMTDAPDTSEPSAPAQATRSPTPGASTSIVPADTIAGRALVAVIAIMSFLAALTVGGVVLVRGAATEWQEAVAREVTIQIRPADGRAAEARARRGG